MAAPHSLRRLHKLRQAEEEQRNALLRSALGELHKLESASRAVHGRLIRARLLLTQSLLSAEMTARFSALEEITASQRLVNALSARIHVVEAMVEERRENLLVKRVERRQAEALLDSIVEQQELQERRKAQVALDDWYRSRPAGTIPRDTRSPSDSAHWQPNSPDSE